MMDKIKIISLIIGIIFTCGCCPRPPEHAWTINNNYDTEVSVYTIYQNYSSFDLFPAIRPCTILPHNSYEALSTSNISLYSELENYPNTKIYFLISHDNISDLNVEDIVKYSVAYYYPSINAPYEWKSTINFPEDCTVNLELGEIYDLDEFVELYGPLNAQGWDEVWQRWQQSKLIPDAQL